VTSYEEALARSGGTRTEKVMALYCSTVIPRLGGAFSPRLVWEGAVAAGLSPRDLSAMVAGPNLAALRALQDMAGDLR
jgi:hypothetical protein